MKSTFKSVVSVSLILTSCVLSACSGPVGSGSSPGSGSGSGSGPFTIGGTVTGLVGTGLVLQDNAIDSLTISANGSFIFKTAIASGQLYSVSVSTPPSTPSQTCTVTSGSGTVTANVTNVQVTCSTGTASIGGNVVGLLGTGLVLQNNGGDNLTVATSGSFTFKTAIALGKAYLVTVSTQPTSPAQTCTVTNGSGTASANVGNIQITCSTGTLSIGGTVTGLANAGTGIVLQNNGGDNLTLKANGSFTMPTLVPAGGAYKITILTQPSGPNQTCIVSNGTGTANANVTSVQVTCPAVFHTIGGTVVGLVGTNGSMVLQNNLGDNLAVPANGTFTFNTPIADGSKYDVSILNAAGTQPQTCVDWFFTGFATGNVTSVVVDCGHNDWAWLDGSNLVDQKGAFTPPPATPPVPPVFDTDSPGGRKYPATWTDLSGNLWLFGGDGWTYTFPNAPQPIILNDMWEYTGTQNYSGSFTNLWSAVTPAGPVPVARTGAVTWTSAAGELWLFGGQDGSLNFLNDLWKYNISSKVWTQVGGFLIFNQKGIYTGVTPFPGSRWGANARLDSSGTVWLFGGQGYDKNGTTPGLLNDLWNYNIATGQWTWISITGTDTINQTGSYGTLGTPAVSNFPGGRETSAAWLDASGNFWLFGGFDLDSKGSPAALNDLWEFKTGQWTWVSGANVSNQTGVYGTQGVAAATNVPGARWSSAAWTDASGNLWLFGGQGYDSAGNGSLADLWEYKGGQWIWTKGPSSVSQIGIYGLTPGPIIYPYVGNGPGSRYAPGYWNDKSGQFWIFGGEGFDSAGANGFSLLNDLWRYLPYP
jgi:N-acetylneuraminic acid mutarotase